MKKISADYIFPGNSDPIKNGVIIYDETGEILDLLDPQKHSINWDEIEVYPGIICPGFINTHCHLELSHLKGEISESTKLPGFVKEIIALRNNASSEAKKKAMRLAEQEMIDNGIVAVGDISNGTSSFSLKELGSLKYHTFIEVFGSDPKIASEAFGYSADVFKQYFDHQRASITPHATYSVSDSLVELINKHAINNDSLITIHNQETASENLFFKAGKGEMFDFLDIANKTNHGYKPSGFNALPSFLGKFNSLKKVLLVHNTFTAKSDVEWVRKFDAEIYWCFCPNANEYIEKRQPNYALFKNEKCTVGTDSLASNWSLSILDELKTISKKDPTIPLKTLITWATFNGAKFLDFKELGNIEKGKTPGLNLITNIVKLNLSEDSSIKKII